MRSGNGSAQTVAVMFGGYHVLYRTINTFVFGRSKLLSVVHHKGEDVVDDSQDSILLLVGSRTNFLPGMMLLETSLNWLVFGSRHVRRCSE
jgi:hypothetical protein